MRNPLQLARQAVRGAFEVRRDAGLSKTEPLCVFDVAETVGVEVKFFSGDTTTLAYRPLLEVKYYMP